MVSERPLPPINTGRWGVWTESETCYQLDLDGRTITRALDSERVEQWLAARGTQPKVERIPEGERHQAPGLHAAGRLVDPIQVSPIRIGASMTLWIDLLGDPGVVTVRPTGPVVQVQRLLDDIDWDVP